MAVRPRLNLNATHFKDSYRAEIDCLKHRHELMKDFLLMQMENEFRENNSVREYLEKTYRLLHEQMENKWQYTKPEKIDDEVEKREYH